MPVHPGLIYINSYGSHSGISIRAESLFDWAGKTMFRPEKKQDNETFCRLANKLGIALTPISEHQPSGFPLITYLPTCSLHRWGDSSQISNSPLKNSIACWSLGTVWTKLITVFMPHYSIFYVQSVCCFLYNLAHFQMLFTTRTQITTKLFASNNCSQIDHENSNND